MWSLHLSPCPSLPCGRRDPSSPCCRGQQHLLVLLDNKLCYRHLSVARQTRSAHLPSQSSCRRQSLSRRKGQFAIAAIGIESPWKHHQQLPDEPPTRRQTTYCNHRLAHEERYRLRAQGANLGSQARLKARCKRRSILSRAYTDPLFSRPI